MLSALVLHRLFCLPTSPILNMAEEWKTEMEKKRRPEKEKKREKRMVQALSSAGYIDCFQKILQIQPSPGLSTSQLKTALKKIRAGRGGWDMRREERKSERNKKSTPKGRKTRTRFFVELLFPGWIHFFPSFLSASLSPSFSCSLYALSGRNTPRSGDAKWRWRYISDYIFLLMCVQLFSFY